MTAPDDPATSNNQAAGTNPAASTDEAANTAPDGTDLVLDVPEDDALLAWLRRVSAHADPVPPLAHELARAAFSVRDLDAELAVLVLDSETVDDRLAGVRGGDDVRLLSYEAPAVGIELQVVVRGTRRDLLGQVVGDALSVVVQTEQGEYAVEPDASGVFRLADQPAGRVRVRVRGTGGVTVLTPWTVL